MRQLRNYSGINAFIILYYGSLLFIAERLIAYSYWLVKLIVNGKLPSEPFFSKVIANSTLAHIDHWVYLVFGVLYIFFYLFIAIGLVKLSESINLLQHEEIFTSKIGSSFRNAAKLFLVYVFGTFAVDVILLFVLWTSQPVLSLIGTETIVFTLFAYLMYFLADIFEECAFIKEENELTI